MPNLTREEFVACVERERGATPGATLVMPVAVRLIADQITPVVAYRRLVAADQREAPSFLLESVEGGERQGRYSILGAQPAAEVVARRFEVEHVGHAPGEASWRREVEDPFSVLRERTRGVRLVSVAGVPGCFLGGWVGYAGYDSVRYGEAGKLSFDAAPRDDRGLPDLHFGFYDGVVVFDHVEKAVNVVALAAVGPGASAAGAYDAALGKIRDRVAALDRHSEPMRAGELAWDRRAAAALPSNLSREEHAAMVARALEYIRAGDVFQVVLGQRFERKSEADPFDVYRALRTVNPSPYMVYLQARGCILVASSPEILCRVRRHPGIMASRHQGEGEVYVVTNRPLAGTRKRGTTPEEDAALERELLADEKERAEHIMLVDLGRNDVGRVAEPGSVRLAAVMEVERYSHVMHISSTVTGVMRAGLDCWDALRAALPVGTISGAPKIRAMQVIDELEPIRRGPYGGGMGYVGLDGQMDIALTLRTMVVPTGDERNDPAGTAGPPGAGPAGTVGSPTTNPAGAGGSRRTWTYHLQASGGIVADSRAEAEYQETVNKAAGLARAIDAAEGAFGGNAPVA